MTYWQFALICKFLSSIKMQPVLPIFLVRFVNKLPINANMQVPNNQIILSKKKRLQTYNISVALKLVNNIFYNFLK